MKSEKTSKRVLAIVGSPRKGGNTESLVDAILVGAEQGGASIKKVLLKDLTIGACRACNACRKTNTCVQKDDMHPLIKQMSESDVWILGTPIYWWGPTAQFKAFIDRWYGIDRSIFRGKDVILAIPLGGSDRYAEHTVAMLRDIIDYLGMNLYDILLAPGSSKIGAVRNKSALMEASREVGLRIVQES